MKPASWDWSASPGGQTHPQGYRELCIPSGAMMMPGKNRGRSAPMPKRAYKASLAAYNRSVGHASTHIWDNLVVWMVACAVVTAVAAYLVAHPVGLDSQ